MICETHIVNDLGLGLELEIRKGRNSSRYLNVY